MESANMNAYTEDDYYAMSETVHAELVNGQIYYLAAPSRLHQEVVHFLDKLIGNYIDSKGGLCRIYPAPFAVKLFDTKDTIVEPDISVICTPDKLTDKGCTGAPDWIVEVSSPGTASHDHVLKLNLYMEAGVKEYWIVNPQTKKVFVYFLSDDAFAAESYTFHDKIKVNIYEDLYIDFKELPPNP